MATLTSLASKVRARFISICSLQFASCAFRRSGPRPSGRWLALFGLLPAMAWSQAQMYTPGAFAVTETGAAAYSIPIQVPPGTSGMQPALSLNYNSQAGDGLMGTGWYLGGLSAVHRCPATFLIDNFKGGINYDANDRFCLDGARLIPVNGGANGANGTEYRTQNDSFARVISYGAAGSGPAYFRAWTKSGQILDYGTTTASAIEAVGKASIRVWSLQKVADRTSNYFTVSYSEDGINGQYYPVRIDYTGNSGAGVTPYNSVQFTYEARLDVNPLYIGGSSVAYTSRISGISTYAGAALVKKYAFTYYPGGAIPPSQLTGLQECDPVNICFYTTFTWPSTLSGNQFTEIPATAAGFTDAGGWNTGLRYFTMDVNGDARATSWRAMPPAT